ncbi:MAG: DUF721 domain-containing protein [Candidatus Gastranaerophilales bacterium]|nr:DUF721 domain-containing protein [Candidatus Gastranaerophilales bacterium]
MAKKVLYTDFEGVDSIIECMMSKDLKKALTRNNLYKFWSKIVGKTFSEKSRPYSIAGNGVLVIACANSAVAQELLLQKKQILIKFQPYLKSLHLSIKDIKFDPKKWEEM